MRYGWQLDKSRWEELADTCRDREWTKTYLEDVYKSSIPKTSGVYIICASLRYVLPPSSLRDDLYNAIYVGQATNLRRRFTQHVRGYRNVPKALEAFKRLDYWFTEVGLAELDDVEQSFLDTLGPTANDKNVRAKIGRPIPAGRVGSEPVRGSR